jgi:heterodisulfide reductase subunit A
MPETNGAPKIGVYICHCGVNIAAKVNIPEVVEFAKTLPFVTVAREYKFMCSDPGQELIQQDLREGRINRVCRRVVLPADARGDVPTGDS